MVTITPTSPAVPTTISNLASAASVNSSDYTVIVQNGVTKKALASQFTAVAQANTIVAGNGVSVATAANVSTVSLAALTSAEILVGNASNVATPVTVSGDATLSNTGALTLDTVNSNVGSFTNASVTVNAKGLITAASSGSGATLPVLSSFKNLKIVWASNTTATVTFDQMLLQTSGAASAYLATNFAIGLNSAISGAGGLDTGSLAASTWYFVYIIFNGSSGATLMSLSSTAPTLPSGYTYATGAIGVVKTDGSKNFIGFIQYGRQWQYVVGNNLSVLPTMASGGAFSFPTAIAIGNYVPSIASVGRFIIGGGSGSSNYQVAPNNSYTTNTCIFVQQSNVASQIIHALMLESTNIYWGTSSGGYNALAFGFELNI